MVKKPGKKEDRGGLVFVGSLLICLGIGLGFGRPDVGVLVGLGVGFILMSIVQRK